MKNIFKQNGRFIAASAFIIAICLFQVGCDKKENSPVVPSNSDSHQVQPSQSGTPDMTNYPDPSKFKTTTKLHKSAVTCPVDRYCGPMDVAFIIDNTGSMFGAINNVKAELNSILDCIETTSGNDYRLSLVTLGDIGNPGPGDNQRVMILNNFAANNKAAVSVNMMALVAGGGNGTPECTDEALGTVVTPRTKAQADAQGPVAGNHQNVDYSPDWRAAARKLVILVTDAPPSGFNDAYTAGVDDVNAHNWAVAAFGRGITISAVYVPTGVSPTTVTIMQDYATTTNGVYHQTAADGTGTSDAIIDIISTCGFFEIPINIDIHPVSCPNPFNMKQNGIVPLAILGSATFDVTRIDYSTVKLNGVPIVANWAQLGNVSQAFGGALNDCYSCTSAGPDIFPDMSLKIDAPALAASLTGVVDGECKVVELTGNLLPAFGGTRIRGADILKIIKK